MVPEPPVVEPSDPPMNASALPLPDTVTIWPEASVLSFWPAGTFGQANVSPSWTSEPPGVSPTAAAACADRPEPTASNALGPGSASSVTPTLSNVAFRVGKGTCRPSVPARLADTSPCVNATPPTPATGPGDTPVGAVSLHWTLAERLASRSRTCTGPAGVTIQP